MLAAKRQFEKKKDNYKNVKSSSHQNQQTNFQNKKRTWISDSTEKNMLRGRSLTQNEENCAHDHSSRHDVLCAFLVCGSVHGPKLICYWMCPKISKKESTNKNGKGSIAGTFGYVHFDWTNGIDIEIQDHDKKDNRCERHNERKPRFDFTLEINNKQKPTKFVNTIWV